MNKKYQTKTNHNESVHNHSHQKTLHVHGLSNLSGKKIFWVTILNIVITVAEILGGIFSGSLALISDSLHNLSDTTAIALSYFANKISKKTKNIKKTFGYKRSEILAAFVNSAVLLAISLMLIFEAIKRFQKPETIDGTLMIVVAIIGLISNLFSVFLLEKDSHKNLNIKSSYLHLIGDTVSSIGVVLGGIAIKLFNITWIDPVITILVSLYIIKEVWYILKKTTDILMQSAPNIDFEGIKRNVEKIEGVKNIHHVHSWMLNEETIHFEAHIDLDNMLLCNVEKIYDKINHLLKENYGIEHVTLQPEINNCCDKNLIN